MKEHKTLLCCVIVVVVFLIGVQILFSLPAPNKWLEAVWSAGDFIIFVGTIVLGGVAITQTQQANKISAELMKIEKDRDRLDLSPFFVITDYNVYKVPFYDTISSHDDKLYVEINKIKDNENILGIGLHLMNTTDSFITAEFFSGSSNKGKWMNCMSNQSNGKLCLQPKESAEIVFYSNESFIKDLRTQKITMIFKLENRIAEPYMETFDITIASLLKLNNNQNSEWYCDCIIENYNVKEIKTKQERDSNKSKKK